MNNQEIQDIMISSFKNIIKNTTGINVLIERKINTLVEKDIFEVSFFSPKAKVLLFKVDILFSSSNISVCNGLTSSNDMNKIILSALDQTSIFIKK